MLSHAEMQPGEFVVMPEPRSHFVLLEKLNTLGPLGCCQFRQSSDNLLMALWFLSNRELSVVLKIPVCVCVEPYSTTLQASDMRVSLKRGEV